MSDGAADAARPYIGQAYVTMLLAAGVDGVAVNCLDPGLADAMRVILQQDPANAYDRLLLRLYDVTKAEVDLSTAKLNLIKAENAFRLARVTLNNAMGLPEAPDYEVEDRLSSGRQDMDLEEAIRKAYDRRPDLKAMALKRKSQEQSIELVRKAYYPSLTGSAGYGWGGGDFPLERGWSFGAEVSIPLFTGFSTQ